MTDLAEDTIGPKVSIGVACYNHERFIEACLDSIKAQSWRKYELFISDDCSTDRSREVIKAWDEKNPGVITRILLPEHNQGIAKNLNLLRSYMTGDYMSFFSGDDRMLPTKVERQVRALEDNPEAGLCYTDMHWWDPDKGESWFRHFGILQRPPENLEALIRENVLPSPTFMTRVSHFPEAGLDERLPIVNDYKFAIDLLTRAPAVYVDEPLVYYTKHQASITAQGFYAADRFKLHAILKKSFKGKYDDALRTNKAVCYYALGREINNSGRRQGVALAIFCNLCPYYFTSVKWFLRGAMYLRSFMK